MDPVDRPVVLDLPFEGRWLARNSPARRVPSHGSDLFGERFAIDFIGVHGGRSTSTRRDWRTLLATEPAERFVGFGRPILAPADGIVVAAHDGEPDHAARRSQLALVPYALGQRGRISRGIHAVAGNYVIIEILGGRAFVALVHLQAGSLSVGVGARLTTGQRIGRCGNSGNSTQPHLHLQVMDNVDLAVARGMPTAFRCFREWPARGKALMRGSAVPGEGSVIEPCAPATGP